MNFFPEIEAKANWRLRFSRRLSFVSLTALSFLMQCGPALAEKVEQTTYAKAQRPPDAFLLGLFTVLNYIAGIAILATLVFSVIWFFQKRNDPGETDTVDSEAEAEAETTAAAAATEAKTADSAESKADEKKAEEKKSDETKSDETKSEDSKSEEKKED